MNKKTVFFTLFFYVISNFILLQLAAKNYFGLSINYPFRWDVILKLDKPLDWIVLGDSIGGLSLIPDMIEKKLTGNAYNLSTYAGHTLLKDAWLIDAYVQRWGAPKAVIIVHGLHVWTNDNDDWEWISLPLRNILNLDPRPRLPYAEWFYLLMQKLVPLRYVSIKWDFPSPSHTKFYSSSDKGFAAKLPKIPKKYIKGLKPTSDQMAWLPGDPNAGLSITAKQMLGKMDELAFKYGFDVFIVLQPVFRGSLKYPEYQKKIKQAEIMFRQFPTRSGRFYFIFDASDIPDQYFMDENHIYYTGAVEYSNAVISSIHKRRILSHRS